MAKIGFGGSCHWCTEAIFLSLKGVDNVQQGWIAADGADASFSEGVIVSYNPAMITLPTLIGVHLYTHSCTSNHVMRSKYRSAIYTFDEEEVSIARQSIENLQKEYSSPIITRVLTCRDFKINSDEYLNYYYSNPEKPFCESIVNPKLRLLMRQFSNEVDSEKLKHLQNSTSIS